MPLPEALTDEELCALLRISRTTLWRELNGVGSDKRPPGEPSIKTIAHRTVGGVRRWSRDSALRFLNGKEE